VAKSVRKPVSALNRLVVICLNGRYGFNEAARVVRDPHLAAILTEYAHQREQFCEQLMYQVSRLGGRPEKHGTVAGLAHRRWMDVRSVIGGEDVAILHECERGEHHAAAAYERALASDLPEEIRNLLKDQLAQIRDAQRNLWQLQNRLCTAC
jgi:uncharacterized protein (TIGR02284 family)